jgi:hypothetical protein
MAYTLTPEEQQKLNPSGEGAPPMAQAPGGSIISGTSANSTPTQSKGSGFTNISQYLNENKDQAANLTNKVGGYVQNQVNDTNTKIDSGANQFNEQVKSSTPSYNADLFNKVSSDPTKLTEQDKTSILSQKNASYVGPNAFEGSSTYGDITNSIDKAKNTLSGLNTEAGRSEVLGHIQNPKRASAGVTTLNNLFLQNDPNSRNTLGALQGNTSLLDKRLEEAKLNSASNVNQAKQQSTNVASQANQSLNAANTAFSNKVESDAKARKDALDTLLNFKGGNTATDYTNLRSTASPFMTDESVNKYFGSAPDYQSALDAKTSSDYQAARREAQAYADLHKSLPVDAEQTTQDPIFDTNKGNFYGAPIDVEQTTQDILHPTAGTVSQYLNSKVQPTFNQNKQNFYDTTGMAGHNLLDGSGVDINKDIQSQLQNQYMANTNTASNTELQKLLALQELLGNDSSKYLNNPYYSNEKLKI